MENYEAFVKELLEKYPDLREMKPPYNLSLCGKLITVVHYSTAADSIKELKLGHLCKRLDAFSTDFKDNTYGIYIKDGLDKQYMLKCVAHEIGHIIGGHFENAEIGEKEEADAREFEACFQKLLQAKEERRRQNTKSKAAYFYLIFGLIAAALLFFAGRVSVGEQSIDAPPQGSVISETPVTADSTNVPPPAGNKIDEAIAARKQAKTKAISILIDKILDEDTKVYVTSSGENFHREKCSSVMNKTNLTEFTIADAILEGYGACGLCRPLD